MCSLRLIVTSGSIVSTRKGTNTPAMRGAGRPKISTHEEIQQIALEMFIEYGFDEVTIEEVAEACGISRRTLFRYYSNKMEIVWGDFDRSLAYFSRALEEQAQHLSLGQAILAAVIDFNQIPKKEIKNHRKRMNMILFTPSLQSYSSRKRDDWKQVITDFLIENGADTPLDWYPALVADVCLAASESAYRTWLEKPSSSLDSLIAERYTVLGAGIPDSLVPHNQVLKAAKMNASKPAVRKKSTKPRTAQ